MCTAHIYIYMDVVLDGNGESYTGLACENKVMPYCLFMGAKSHGTCVVRVHVDAKFEGVLRSKPRSRSFCSASASPLVGEEATSTVCWMLGGLAGCYILLQL